MLGIGDAPEQRVLHQALGEGDEVAGTRTVAGVVEADRVRVARVAQPELVGGVIHLGHEVRTDPETPIAQRHRGVVGARSTSE